MKLKIDNEADALYLTLDESNAVESEEVSPGIIVDYNTENHVVGIEMLYLSKRTPKLDTGRLLFEMAPKSRSAESDVIDMSNT
ncbi:DUF2283 domain-containing protein [Desulfobacterium sp. N47]|uniref:DUF2283 domain-containing protein n=1 Tax=uncultured Desulfobacterium sp. TaxID=201089 RepID=E1YJV4_9BACT|nr:hypothetical protein N47_E50700 [uncultured Desulfobacterium sp.]